MKVPPPIEEIENLRSATPYTDWSGWQGLVPVLLSIFLVASVSLITVFFFRHRLRAFIKKLLGRSHSHRHHRHRHHLPLTRHNNVSRNPDSKFEHAQSEENSITQNQS